jgi:ABC-type enterochelin transport system ATPase subunit
VKKSGEFISKMSALREEKVTTVKMTVSDGQVVKLSQFYFHQGVQKERDINDIGLAYIEYFKFHDSL